MLNTDFLGLDDEAAEILGYSLSYLYPNYATSGQERFGLKF